MNKNKVTKSIYCFGCSSSGLIPKLDLGIMEHTGRFIDPSNPNPLPKASLCIVSCYQCGLTQLSEVIDVNELYGEGYGYESHLNSNMKFHLQSKAQQLEKLYLGESNNVVLDIASNDGTFLSGFLSSKNVLIGLDPAIDFLKDKYPKGAIKINTFFTASSYFASYSKKANLVNTCSVLYDTDKPQEFISDISQVLADGGYWHSEQSYLPLMVENMSFDTICHEHLLYLRLTDINKWCQESDLNLISVEFNQINGGSFAFTAQKKSKHIMDSPKYIDNLIKKEQILDYDGQILALDKFSTKVESYIKEIKLYLNNLINDGYIIYGLGASTKGNVLLQAISASPSIIKQIGDINEKKFGLLTPGTNIPIVSETEVMNQASVKTVFIVLPWHFRDTIIKKMKELYPNKKIKLLFLLPRISLVEI